MRQRSDSSHRLFFALEPPDPVRSRIHAVGEMCARFNSGRGVPVANLHLTLRFLGAQPESSVERIVESAGVVQTAPFPLVLNRFGHWSRPRALWLGPQITPVSLLALHAGLETVMERGCGIARDPGEYRPHVTLMRKVRVVDKLPESVPIEWRVDSFSLMESISGSDGVRYQTISRWKLGDHSVKRESKPVG